MALRDNGDAHWQGRQGTLPVRMSRQWSGEPCSRAEAKVCARLDRPRCGAVGGSRAVQFLPWVIFSTVVSDGHCARARCFTLLRHGAAMEPVKIRLCSSSALFSQLSYLRAHESPKSKLISPDRTAHWFGSVGSRSVEWARVGAFTRNPLRNEVPDLAVAPLAAERAIGPNRLLPIFNPNWQSRHTATPLTKCNLVTGRPHTGLRTPPYPRDPASGRHRTQKPAQFGAACSLESSSEVAGNHHIRQAEERNAVERVHDANDTAAC
ncbi:hypothetical protein L1887_56047 [Cichorium endivia]|nr:hypothetical protein L1887_56047 [Cichorium endivia]